MEFYKQMPLRYHYTKLPQKEEDTQGKQEGFKVEKGFRNA